MASLSSSHHELFSNQTGSQFSFWKRALATLVVGMMTVFTGCETDGQSGLLIGAGVGALAGQAIGGSTEATLIGTAVGSGVGYVVGNERDKKKASERSRPSETRGYARERDMGYAHEEVTSLGGTRWSLISLVPRDAVPPYSSKVIEFGRDGRVITTTTSPAGTVNTTDDSYRVVGDTLIINEPGRVINSRFNLSDDQLIISAEDYSAVWQRLR